MWSLEFFKSGCVNFHANRKLEHVDVIFVLQVMRGHCRICLTAPSHAAVDELLRRLNKYNRNIGTRNSG